MTKKEFTKKDFVSEWCKTIQGNIWKNECILEFRETLPDQNPVELDAIKDNIKKDSDSLAFFKKQYEIE